MHLLRKALIPLAGVAVIALAISVVRPHAVRAFVPLSPSFSPTAVRYPWEESCYFNNKEPGAIAGTGDYGAIQLYCDAGSPRPTGALFVIQTINRVYSTNLMVDAIVLKVFTTGGGQSTTWVDYTTPQLKGPGAYFYASSLTTLYSDPGTKPQVRLAKVGGPAEISFSGEVDLIGYYVYPPPSGT